MVANFKVLKIKFLSIKKKQNKTLTMSNAAQEVEVLELSLLYNKQSQSPRA